MNAALENYLAKHGNAAALSRMTGMTAPTISRLKSGRIDMTLRSALLIEVATKGEVKVEDLLSRQDDLELVQTFAAMRGKA